MIRRRLRRVVLVIACTMAAGAPPAAAAPLHLPTAMLPAKLRVLARVKLRSNEHGPSLQSRFHLKTSNGYEVTVVGVKNVVALEVKRPSKRPRTVSFPSQFGQAVTAYVTRGTVSSRRIDADYPGFGEVQVRFRPSGRVAHHKPQRCGKHAHLVRRYGVFVGRIHFTGEAGYVKVRAHRAKGTVLTPLRLHCRHRRSHHRRARHAQRHRQSRSHHGHRRRLALAGHQVADRGHRPFKLLEAGSRHALVATEVVAAKLGGQEMFLATAEQSTGRMAEVRYAFAVASSKAFRSNNALTSATVKPPAPFHGKGIYSADAQGERSWTGSLSASFPGASGLPLTGVDFTVALRAAI